MQQKDVHHDAYLVPPSMKIKEMLSPECVRLSVCLLVLFVIKIVQTKVKNVF